MLWEISRNHDEYLGLCKIAKSSAKLKKGPGIALEAYAG